MSNPSGQMATAVMLAVLLAAGIAWVIATLYRRKMLALMRGAPGSIAAGAVMAAGSAAPAVAAPSPTLDHAANRRAMRLLLVVLTAVCLAVALTQSLLALAIQFQALTPGRWLVLGAIYAWPMVLAWGLALRWPWRRVVVGTGIYVLLMVVLVMLRSNEQQSLGTVTAWLFTEVGIPMTVALLLSVSGRIRAVAPYLLPFALVLTGISHLALGMLAENVQASGAWLAPLLALFGATGTIAVVAVAPWLLAAWPIYVIGRGLAVAYRRKRFSDLGYLFGVYWFVILLANAIPATAGVGIAGLSLMLAWFWIPLAGWWLKHRAARQEAPASLLVLRVFHHDAQVEHLFDQVIERWRFSGNTMLIAGTDLISRTLDPDDLFTFLEGRLAARFVNTPADVAPRLAAFDLEPDPDGRHRVNECYCRDTTWELALDALVKTSDVVLMDLRGFQPHNQGCRHELGVLATAANVRRVVILYDDTTARATAEADLAGAPAERFRWLEAGGMNTAKAREVLASLFAA